MVRSKSGRITPVFIIVAATSAVLLTVGIRYMFLGAYEVVGASECGSVSGVCFEYCESQDECFKYNLVRMKALDTPTCNWRDETCILDGCEGAGPSCAVVSCSNVTLAQYGYEGVRCVDD